VEELFETLHRAVRNSIRLTIRAQAGSVARRLPEKCVPLLRSSRVTAVSATRAPRGGRTSRRELSLALEKSSTESFNTVQNRLARSTPRFRPQA
jgi:hypothetical protein